MATYIPNASDAAQPTTEKFVYSAAEEFRKIKERINDVAASVNTGAAPAGGLTVTNQQMTPSTPNGRLEIIDTNPLTWNTGPSSMYAQFEFISNNYFSLNPNGHLAVVLRCDTALIGTEVRGQGCVFGNLTGAQEGTQVNPGIQVETFAGTLRPSPTTRYLLPYAESAPGKPLQDGVRYRVQVESVLTSSGIRGCRVTVGRENSLRAAWDLELDTGYVSDDNIYTDFSKTGLVFGHVFGSGALGWSIDIQNLVIKWGPAPTDDSANIDRLSRFGGTVEGPLAVTGAVSVGTYLSNTSAGAREYVNNASGQFASWTATMSSTTNGNSTKMIMPNGTAVNANFLATNKSSLSAAYGYVSYGIEANRGVIETAGHNGATTPDLLIRIGGATSGTFTAGRFAVPALNVASATVDLGTDLYTGLYDLGGTQARILWEAAQNMEGLSTTGTISSFVGGVGATVNGGSLENSIRPIYAYLSVLIAELQRRKII